MIDTVIVLLAIILVCCPLLLSPNESTCNPLHVTSLQQTHNSHKLGQNKTENILFINVTILYLGWEDCHEGT